MNIENWYAVYPGSEKLDIGDKTPVAIFKHIHHAEEMINKYGYYGYIEQI